MDNPYLDEVRDMVRLPGQPPWYELDLEVKDSWRRRREATRRYAWAIPCAQAIAVIARRSPLIEIGAGTGYWARLIAEAGADILAFDANDPGPANHWHPDEIPTYFRVLAGGPEKIREHPGRTLFLCWPPYREPMALDCLAAYQGRELLFVGESDGGCTACERFWESLMEQFEHTELVEIPQYPGINDYLSVWTRK